MQGNDPDWREALHLEHTGGYHPENAWHSLVDGHVKYGWNSQTGQELLFDLDRTPLEQHDLLREPGAEERVDP